MSGTTLLQLLSVLGAGLVLAAFGASQYGSLRSDGISYGLLNLVGSALLALSAVQPLNAGVLVVEAAWSVLSLGIVVRAWQRRGVTGNVGHA
jgi:hypothetical protein